jgi:hypothetical protein
VTAPSRALIFLALIFGVPNAHAIKTASSFDVSYGMAQLTVDALDSNGNLAETRGLNSSTGFQIDYNVALFDYRTVATLSFMQFQTSNVGDVPLSRLALGASYHFFRVNGQRVIMDTDVESKIWGVSPALEVTLGVNKLSINDSVNFQFTSSLIDLTPRILVEVPITSNILLMLRGGYFLTLMSGSIPYKINLSGMVLNAGIKLTTF